MKNINECSFTTNEDDLLDLIASMSDNYLDYFKSTRQDSNVIFEFSGLPPVKYFCNYKKKKNYFEFTKNSKVYQIIITVDCENPNNRDFYQKVYPLIFSKGENIHAIYKNVEELSKSNCYSVYEIIEITEKNGET